MLWRALAWIVASTIAMTPSWGAENRVLKSSLRIVHGNQNPVCRASLGTLDRTPRKAFFDGAWRESFRSVPWQDDSYKTVTAEGRDWSVPYKHARADIDNDGLQDIVVVYTGSIRSVDIDHLFVMSPSEFKQRRQLHTVTRGAQINPDNTVLFADGVSALPVEVHVWKYKGKRYLLMKEANFGRPQYGEPRSLFVGGLHRDARTAAETHPQKRLVLEMICRIQGS